MTFTFEPPHTIENEDGSVSLLIVGALPGPEGGKMFVLTMDGKEIGFATAFSHAEERNEKLPDGAFVWRIGEVGCRFYRHSRYSDNPINNIDVPAYKFEDRAEQDRAMALFAEALSKYSGRKDYSKSALEATFLEDQGKVLVEYFPEVLANAKRGEYIK